MKRLAVLFAFALLPGCDSITGSDYANIEVSQSIPLGASSASITVNSIGDGELSGSWSAQYCTGGTFNFCTSDSGGITGTMDEGSNPNLSAILHSDGCSSDGSLSGMYSAAADRITGTITVVVNTGSSCVSRSGSF